MDSRLFTKVLLIGIAAFVCASNARADLIVSAGLATVNAGSSGNGLDVELTNTGPSAVTIEAFSFGITTANSAIAFTEANVSTSMPYIFAGDSEFGPDIAVTTGQTLTASDLDVSFAGVSLAPGAVAGLGHLLFDVASDAAPGATPVTLLTFPTTSLADDQGNDVAIQMLSPGEITIVSSTVPEPSSLPMAAAGIALVLIFAKRESRPS